MKSNIMNYINTLESFKTYIKTCHWGSHNMSEHKLCDEIADEIAENQDEVSEIAQGLFGQLKVGTLKPVSMKFKSTKDLLNTLISKTNAFYKTINGDQFIGMRSVIEAFLGNLNKFQYLLNLCLKEDINRRLKANINENKTKNKMRLTENELRGIIRQAIHRAILK